MDLVPHPSVDHPEEILLCPTERSTHSLHVLVPEAHTSTMSVAPWPAGPQSAAGLFGVDMNQLCTRPFDVLLQNIKLSVLA